MVILILHPVAAGLSLIGFCFSVFLGSHDIAILTLIVAVVTGIAAAVVFAIDLALVIIVKNEINTNLASYHIQVDWGNAVWMVLTAVVLTWIAVILLSARACYCCGVRR